MKSTCFRQGEKKERKKRESKKKKDTCQMLRERERGRRSEEVSQ